MTSLKYCGAVLLLATSVSHAGHVPFNWSGPYLGAYIGGAWGQSNLDTDAGSVTGSSYYISTSDINAVNQSGSPSLSPSAFIGGIQLGDNFVFGRFVYGIVLDYGSFHLSETKNAVGTYPSGAGNYSEDMSIQTDWLYTMRGRIGYIPMESYPFLVYITGGLALTNPSLSNSFSDDSSLSGVGGGSNDTVQTGWTAGLGLEYPVFRHFTVDAEYLFVQFNSVEIDSAITNSAGGFGILPYSLNNPLETTASLYANLFKIGLNYKF
jgi:outer membrane immunogenic protein